MKNTKFIILLLFSAVLTLVGYGFFIEPYDIEVRHVQVDDAERISSLNGKTIIHLSDFHIGKIGKFEERVLSVVASLNPDMIFLTGDYVEWTGDYAPVLQFLSRLKAKIGVWAVMGDYDYSNSRKSCLFCHKSGTGEPTERHKVRFLKNSMDKIHFSDKTVNIYGIDSGSEDSVTVKKALNELGGEKPDIVLSHNPLTFDMVSRNQNLLMLAGDTHGGQVRMPAWFWGIVGYEKCAKYSYGLFQVGRKKMFVTKGVGTSHIPIRLFRRPEIVVLHF